MPLAELLRFEWRYHARRLSFLAAALVMAGFALVLVRTGYGPAGVAVTSPYVVTQSLGLLSIFSVFVMTIFAVDAGLRDVEHRMTELVLATPVSRARWFAARVGGALLAGMTVMTLAALVLLAAPHVAPTDPTRVGAARPGAVAWALAALVLPNLVLFAAALVAVAVRTRSTLATYVGAVAIYCLYWVTALLIDSPLMAGARPPTPEALARAALLDPLGLSAFFEQTRHWTVAEKNVRAVTLTGRFLLNRLLWLGVSAGLLGLAYRAIASRGDTRAAAKPARAKALPKEPAPAVAYHPVAPAAGGAAFRAALRSALRLELRQLFGGWTLPALLVLWAVVAGMEAVAQTGGGEYRTHVLPTAALLLDALELPLLLLGTVALAYYGAEILWRERVLGFDALADATPAPSAAFFLAKTAALVLLPLALALVAVLVGLGVQLVLAPATLAPLDLLRLLWTGWVPLALLAVLVVACQVAAPNRWVGMLLGLALGLVARRGESLGLEHPMLRFGAAPPMMWSGMGGYGGAGPSFAAFMLYWTAGAALLGAVTMAFWRRGTGPGRRARWSPGVRRSALAAAALFAGGGVLLFRETTVVHAWESRDASLAWRVGYERAYRRLESRPQPSVAAVRTTVDLFPSARRAEVRGSYTIENRTALPLDTLWVTMPRGATLGEAAMPGAREARHDARFGVHVLVPARPLAPGARAELAFRVALDRGGIRADGAEPDLAPNGTLLMSADAFPTFGYRAGWELADSLERARRGLAPRPDARRGPALPWLTVDAVVTTDADQTALAPGRLVAAATRNGRRVFHYRTERPTTPLFGFASARYAVHRATTRDGVAVEVWHRPADTANVARIARAAARALDELGRRYGRYPHPVLRVVEVPGWWGFGAYALPTMILFPETRGFQAVPREGEVDLVTRRIAHEVSHQWWGHTLDPADVDGASTLVETLAKHSEQLVVRAMAGDAALPPMVAYDEDRYLAGRADDPEAEPTLMTAREQAWLYYGKGAVVMHGLRDLLGADALDRALARLIAGHGGPRADATTADLERALLAEAREARDSALVREWLETTALHDLRVDSAAARREAGRWAVRARVSGGGATDLVDVAVWGADAARPLRIVKVALEGGRGALVTEVDAAPSAVEVDPFVRRLDRDRSDNRRRLAEAP